MEPAPKRARGGEGRDAVRRRDRGQVDARRRLAAAGEGVGALSAEFSSKPPPALFGIMNLAAKYYERPARRLSLSLLRAN